LPRRGGIYTLFGESEELAATMPILKCLAAMEAVEEKNSACLAAIAATKNATMCGATYRGYAAIVIATRQRLYGASASPELV
jgi:hypothetical protein